MMVLTFQKGSEITLIRISGKQVLFAAMSRGLPMYTTIEGLKLNPATIVKEFQDLKGKPVDIIKKEGIIRFKKHILKMRNETEIMNYIKNDLKNHGYKMLRYQKQGFRPVKVDE